MYLDKSILQRRNIDLRYTTERASISVGTEAPRASSKHIFFFLCRFMYQIPLSLQIYHSSQNLFHFLLAFFCFFESFLFEYSLISLWEWSILKVIYKVNWSFLHYILCLILLLLLFNGLVSPKVKWPELTIIFFLTKTS